MDRTAGQYQIHTDLEEAEALLVEGAHTLGISLSDRQLDLFRTYYRLLVEWNRRVNLTALTDPSDVFVKHFLDSITVLLAVDASRHPGRVSGPNDSESDSITLLDVGTGAGFPGLPLRIVHPEFRLTLLDSTRKKTDFLRHLLEALELDDVTVVTGRAEEAGRQPALRERVQLVVSRAVDRMATLAEYLLPFCTVGGRAVAMKKEDISTEIAEAARAIRLMGGHVSEVLPVRLPLLPDERCLVVLEKLQSTPEQYPRRPGMPAKRPL